MIHFDQKYTQVPEGETVHHSEYDSVRKNRYRRPCKVCGAKTYWSSVRFNMFFCSDFCLNLYWDSDELDSFGGSIWSV